MSIDIKKKKTEAYTYTIELDSYNAIQLLDVLGRALKVHDYLERPGTSQVPLDLRSPMFSPQELACVRPLYERLRKMINTPVEIEAIHRVRCVKCTRPVEAGEGDYYGLGIAHKDCINPRKCARCDGPMHRDEKVVNVHFGTIHERCAE